MTDQELLSLISNKTVAVTRSKTLDFKTLELFVCQSYGITPARLKENTYSKRRIFVKPRQTFQYLAYKYTFRSLEFVAYFYDKDHATVLHSCRVINQLIDTKDKEFYPLILAAESRTIKFIAAENPSGKQPEDVNIRLRDNADSLATNLMLKQKNDARFALYSIYN